MREKSLEESVDDILADLKIETSAGADQEESPNSHTTLSLWVTQRDKERYKRLQKLTRRRLAEKLHEVVLLVLDRVEARAS
jgi:hypothetical protein